MDSDGSDPDPGAEPGSGAGRSDRTGAPHARTEHRGGTGPVGPEPVVPMADVMVDMPGVWRRLLVAHVPDRLGRCRGCRSDTGSGVRWPCSLSRIAEQARRLHDRKLTEAIDSD